MNFYKRHLGDYAVDTRHLNYMEHGAYTLLLDFYYSTERALPKEIVKLMAPRTPEEKLSLESVLRQFFFKRNGRFYHKRCMQEIGQYRLKVEAYRASGSKGGSKRQAIAKQSLDKNSLPSLENQIPDTRGQNQRPEPENSTTKSNTIAQNQGASELFGFSLFWDAYPKRVGKPSARRAWLSKVKDDSRYPEVLAGLEMWKQAEQWQEIQFVPYPATFLNQMRWQDEVPKNGGNKNDRAVESAIANAAIVARDFSEMGNPPKRALSGESHSGGNKNLLPRLARH